MAMHRAIRRIQSFAVLALCSAGCGNEDPGRGAPLEESSSQHAAVQEECRTGPVQLRVLTYNAALAPGFEPLALERAPTVIAALAEAAPDIDVMCVQEFWLEEHFGVLERSVAELGLEHSLRMAPKPGSGGCSESELLPLAACLAESCPGATGEEMVDCAESHCGPEVEALSGGCLGCIMNHLDAFTECLGTGEAPSDPAVYGGSYDVGLLSRWPLLRSDNRALSSYFVRASVLYARIAVPGYGPLDTYCTHLGSALGIVPYRGAFGSWEGEHLQQVEEVLEFIEQTNHGARPLLLLGDFNMGPEVGGNSAVWADQYQLAVDAGLDNAYVARTNPLCTTCAGTTFRSASATNEIIDHIFSKRLPTWNTTHKRVFTETVELGEGLPAFNLSDHWGLEARFTLRHSRHWRHHR